MEATTPCELLLAQSALLASASNLFRKCGAKGKGSRNAAHPMNVPKEPANCLQTKVCKEGVRWESEDPLRKNEAAMRGPEDDGRRCLTTLLPEED